MTKYLIAITGFHRLIRRTAEESVDAFDGISYYRSLQEELRADHGDVFPTNGEGLLDLVMQKELQRDEGILSYLEHGGKCALVEQWHFGNLARARMRAPQVAQIYESELSRRLSSFSHTTIREFYVSGDLEKCSSEATIVARRKELKALEAVTASLGYQRDVIDGEVPPRHIRERFLFLLNRILSPATD